jgi:hypothetical protein
MPFQPELLGQLLQSYKKPEDLLGKGGNLKQLTKALVVRDWRPALNQFAIAYEDRFPFCI